MREGDWLFEVEPLGKKRPQGPPAGVGRTFRAFDPHQVMLLPPSLDDWLFEGHSRGSSLTWLMRCSTSPQSWPTAPKSAATRPTIRGSAPPGRRHCVPVPGRRSGTGLPLDRRFRRRYLNALAGLFTQSLHLATKLGMVKMGRAALGSTKLEANASTHKAMSYGRLVDKEERIEAGIAQLESKARGLLAADEAEDQTFGVDGKEADQPAELDRREKRLAKLQAATEKARAHAEDKEHRRQERAGTSYELAVTDTGDQAAAKARPKPKAQANFTDPDSRIMKTVASADVGSRAHAPGADLGAARYRSGHPVDAPARPGRRPGGGALR